MVTTAIPLIFAISSRRASVESLVAQKGARGRSAWIKDEGFFIREIIQNQRIGKCFWICRRCDERRELPLFTAEATNSAARHLRKALTSLPLKWATPLSGPPNPKCYHHHLLSLLSPLELSATTIMQSLALLGILDLLDLLELFLTSLAAICARRMFSML
jgi:hypothetical protein